jgi:dephospho-CoA kinase
VAAEPTVPVFAIAEIPLLYETGNESAFGAVIVAACTPVQQLERLMSRGGLPDTEARARIASQWPIGDKASRADIVIDTSGTFAATDEQVERAIVEITGRALRPQ